MSFDTIVNADCVRFPPEQSSPRILHLIAGSNVMTLQDTPANGVVRCTCLRRRRERLPTVWYSARLPARSLCRGELHRCLLRVHFSQCSVSSFSGRVLATFGTADLLQFVPCTPTWRKGCNHGDSGVGKWWWGQRAGDPAGFVPTFDRAREADLFEIRHSSCAV